MVQKNLTKFLVCIIYISLFLLPNISHADDGQDPCKGKPGNSNVIEPGVKKPQKPAKQPDKPVAGANKPKKPMKPLDDKPSEQSTTSSGRQKECPISSG